MDNYRSREVTFNKFKEIATLLLILFIIYMFLMAILKLRQVALFR